MIVVTNYYYSRLIQEAFRLIKVPLLRQTRDRFITKNLQIKVAIIVMCFFDWIIGNILNSKFVNQELMSIQLLLEYGTYILNL